MKPSLPYHILNTAMIAGGVGFMLNMLSLVEFLEDVKVVHFLALIGGAILLKMGYGAINSKAKDPITGHPTARKFFYLGMLMLGTALVMRNYHIAYYQYLLYVDIVVQLVALF